MWETAPWWLGVWGESPGAQDVAGPAPGLEAHHLSLSGPLGDKVTESSPIESRNRRSF